MVEFCFSKVSFMKREEHREVDFLHGLVPREKYVDFPVGGKWYVRKSMSFIWVEDGEGRRV